MVNIEGEKQNIIPQQYKTNMTRGRAGHVTLPCEWGSKCGGVDQARTCTPLIYPRKKKITFRGMGGGKGGVHRGVAQERHSMSPHHTPTPTPVREKSTFPKHGTSRPLSPPEEQALRKMGGGNRGGSPWRCPRTTLRVAYPPLEKPTIRVMGGGGKGVFTVALHKHGTARRRSPPSPPLMSGIIKN